MPIDLFKPTTVSLEKPQPAPKSPQPGPKLKLDKIKITPEKILRAKTLARPQDLAEPQLSENGLLVLKKRYLKKDEEGKTIETAQDMFWRVASNISQAEQIYNPKANLAQTARQFYDLMASARFLPNSPTLRGAGREMQQLSACFCLPIEDSLDSIMTTLKNACHIFKTGGGCGYSFSRLRPRKDKISTTGNNAGGPVSFMRVYNAAIGEITQGGVRMGANMGMLRCDHPDIEEFIDSKTDMTSMTNFNISVSATDEFMDAIEQNRQYELINPRTNQATGSINARKVFDKICENAWRNGDPGMIFIDKINNSSSNPVKSLGLIEATNPCLTGDTAVITPEGPRKIQDLIGEKTSLLLDGKFYSTTDKGFFSSGIKPVFEIQTKEGYQLKATGNHLIKSEGGWQPVDKLKAGDQIILSSEQKKDKATITNIIPQGQQAVFDAQVPGTNAFSANGIIVHNCGEQPLLPNESCVLGSINLAKFVKEENLDWDELKKTVEQAIHFLDNVIDMNKYVLPEIERWTKGLRRTGLGVMGFADMLVQLGIGYSSAEGIEMAEKIMEFINSQAKETSQKLARERGAYPYFKKSIDFQKGELPLRNVARTTIAPTGTISVIADCSSGIEPIYALVHKRKSIWDKQGAEVELLVADKNFKALAGEQGLDSPEVMEEISRTGSVAHNPQVPEKIRRVFVTAHDLAPLDHIKIQAAFQRHTDNAISKTINFPHSATVDDVKEAYLTAYRLGCKGITIYRDGSRDTQVLTVGSESQAGAAGVPAQVEPRERPNVVMGSTEKISTGMGNLFVTINEDKEGLFEVFAQIGKSGGDAGALVEAIARLISISLRSRVPTDIIIEQLKGIRGSNPVWQNGELILSPPDAIGKALERYLARQKELNLIWKNQKASEEKQQQEALEAKIEEKPVTAQQAGNICPECGDSLIYEEGCVKCPSCKFTKCG